MRRSSGEGMTGRRQLSRHLESHGLVTGKNALLALLGARTRP